MPTTDPRVDAYIATAAEFARPILEKLRALVHRADPGIVETIKWGMPFFDHDGPVCHMAAFKQHAAFGFWRSGTPGFAAAGPKAGEAMGELGRIASLADLPPDRELVAKIKLAVALNREGVKVQRLAKGTRPPPAVPEALAAALRASPKAQAVFDAFSATNRRDYTEWIDEAKTDATRERRVAQAVEWMEQGKPRHWKHQRRG